MEIPTKIFLLNLLLTLLVLNVDKQFFDEALDGAYPRIIGWWSLISLISVPVWCVYAIITA